MEADIKGYWKKRVQNLTLLNYEQISNPQYLGHKYFKLESKQHCKSRYCKAQRRV